MVKVLYRCEICNRNYSNEQDAVECESKGNEEELLKIGDVISEGWSRMEVESIVHHNHYCCYELIEMKYPHEERFFSRKETNFIQGNKNLKDYLSRNTLIS